VGEVPLLGGACPSFPNPLKWFTIELLSEVDEIYIKEHTKRGKIRKGITTD
jgi:hypothetical protein